MMASREIRKDRLLLVEGLDEVNLFDALIRYCFGEEQISNIQIFDAGGINNFRRNLRTIKARARAQSIRVQAIGAIRDADENADDAFRSICGDLHNAGYEPPTDHGVFSDARPAVGVFIVPDGKTPGAIETLCRRSQKGDAVSGCVEDYMVCLKKQGVTCSGNPDKTFAHAYLAAMNDPVARVGEGALQGVWDFDSDAFAHLSDFLHKLLST